MSQVANLIQDLAENSLLLMALSGMRSVIERELGIENIQIATDEMVKQAMLTKKIEEITFPYAYISMSEMIGVKDQAPNKITRKLGHIVGTADATKATIRKAYIFPVTLSLDFKYVDNDPYRTIRMVEALVILSQMDAIYYDIVLNNEFRFHCRVEIPDSEPIPMADTQSPQSPSGIELACTMILHTYCGVIKDVPAVGGSTPNVGVKFAVENVVGGFRELLDE